jgi:hypothetical protein
MAVNIPTYDLCVLLGLTPEEAADPATVLATLAARPTREVLHDMAVPTPVWTASRADVPLPRYQGHGDAKTPSEFVAELERYATAHRLPVEALLATAVPVTLSGSALAWWEFTGGFTTWMAFTKALQAAFGAIFYITLLKRELECRTQHPDECLASFVWAIEGYYKKIGESVTEEDKLRRVMEQLHPEFRRHLVGRTFSSLAELALAGPDIQQAVLRDRTYRPPPPAAFSVEPSLAWKPIIASSQRPEPATIVTSATTAAVHGFVHPAVANYREVTMAAIDPYVVSHMPAWGHGSVAANQGAALPGTQQQQQPSKRRADRRGCWNCGKDDHIARYCKANATSKN